MSMIQQEFLRVGCIALKLVTSQPICRNELRDGILTPKGTSLSEDRCKSESQEYHLQYAT
eukprot:scaffold68078_cov22-Prasinocladus_malaysianus.AAC.1